MLKSNYLLALLGLSLPSLLCTLYQYPYFLNFRKSAHATHRRLMIAKVKKDMKWMASFTWLDWAITWLLHGCVDGLLLMTEATEMCVVCCRTLYMLNNAFMSLLVLHNTHINYLSYSVWKNLYLQSLFCIILSFIFYEFTEQTVQCPFW